MLFEDKLSDIIRTLENDGLLLHPTDTVWAISCSTKSKKAISRLRTLLRLKNTDSFFLLLDTIEKLKKYVPDIHPRIETLLHFHEKPLSVVFPNVLHLPEEIKRTNGSLAIRLIQDPYCNQIIKLLDAPLLSAHAKMSDTPIPSNFNEVPNSIIQHVDFVSKHKRNIDSVSMPSVMIDYNEEGEINFLRL